MYSTVIYILKGLYIKYINALLILLVTSIFSTLNADIIIYKGSLGKTPIKLIIDAPSTDTNYIDAFYIYTKYNTPIPLSGEYKNNILSLYKKDNKNILKATLKFYDYSKNYKNINGFWIDKKQSKKIAIKLKSIQRISLDSDFDTKDIELMQVQSFKNYYFKVVLNNADEAYYPSVIKVNIYTKKSDKLFQSFDVNAQSRGFMSIGTGDFNFDGYSDFSLFESSYAGTNTSSLYFLYNSKTKKYFLSDISGVSLEFDADSKNITSINSSQAGRSVTKETFKVKNNHMQLISSECLKYDDKQDKYQSYNIKECR